MRPVNQIIEFKQIVGRGTRLFDGKEFYYLMLLIHLQCVKLFLIEF
jgi:type I restriction enzyme R subunit